LEEGLQKALHLSNELRKIGMRVTSDPLRRSLKAQMRDANKLESKYIIIIGKEELESEVFIVKNLNKGDQEVLTYSELIELFKKVII
jgi:histidyl-tRNA synthetase